MKNCLKIFPEPESIIKDEFLIFYCHFLTLFIRNCHNSTLLEPNELKICVREVFDMPKKILMVPGSNSDLKSSLLIFLFCVIFG